jgi:hypothetical protein
VLPTFTAWVDLETDAVYVDEAEIEKSAVGLKNFRATSVHLMQVLARACGHSHLNQFNLSDLTTWDREMAYLTGVPYSGVMPL